MFATKAQVSVLKSLRLHLLPYSDKLECLPHLFTSTLQEPTIRVEQYPPLWKALALPAHSRQEWKLMIVSNALAYYDTATITALKVL
jgi:hypothetical protein